MWSIFEYPLRHVYSTVPRMRRTRIPQSLDVLAYEFHNTFYVDWFLIFFYICSRVYYIRSYPFRCYFGEIFISFGCFYSIDAHRNNNNKTARYPELLYFPPVFRVRCLKRPFAVNSTRLIQCRMNKKLKKTTKIITRLIKHRVWWPLDVLKNRIL